MDNDRPKRAATRVTDFRRFHRSGDLQEPRGKEIMATPEELKKQIEEAKENSDKMQNDMEMLCLQNDLEIKRRKQQQWQVAMDKLNEARDHAEQEHANAWNKWAN